MTLSRYYTRLFGKPSSFGIDVDLYHPEDPKEGAFDFSHWGKLRFWVNGRNLAATTSPQGEFLDSIDWEIAPLLEWLARNRNAFLHEEKLPIPDGGPDGASAIADFWRGLDIRYFGKGTGLVARRRVHEWWRRHSIRAASEGGLFPDIVLRRFADDIEISWDSRDPIPGSERVYVEAAGSAILPLDEVHDIISSFLKETVEALLAENPSDAEINEIASTIPTSSEELHREESLLWLSGLRDMPAGASDMEFLSAGVISENGILRHNAVTLLFRSFSPEITPADIVKIEELLKKASISGDNDVEFRKHVRKKALDPQIPAYRQGYDLASQFREEMGLDAIEPFVSMPIFTELGITTMETTLSDKTLRALSFRGPKYHPSVALNQNTSFFEYEHAKEMDLAHELCHLLFDQEYGRPMGIVSGPWAPMNLEKRANAFAAYLRLPAEAIRDIVGRDPPAPINQKILKRIMKKYCVGVTTATYQLLNLGWISEWERQELIDYRSSTDG